MRISAEEKNEEDIRHPGANVVHQAQGQRLCQVELRRGTRRGEKKLSLHFSRR